MTNPTRRKLQQFMRTPITRILLCLIAVATLAQTPARAGLIHRYSFTNSINDSVGAANGTLFGDAVLTNGVLHLDGTNGTYLALPGGILNGLTAVSIEAWASFGTEPVWTRLFDFGNTDAGGNGATYLGFSSHSGAGDMRLIASDADPGYNHEQIAARGGNMDNRGLLHIVSVYDPSNKVAAFYTNGVLVAVNPAVTIPISSISNVFSYIGKSLYNGDPALQADILEFRMHDVALTGPQIAASFNSGPNKQSTDPGALQSISLVLGGGLVVGAQENAIVYASYANVSNQVNVTSLGPITYSSSSTNIITVSSNGTVLAAGGGTASVTATYQGKQVSQNIVVQAVVGTGLIHRYSFTNSANDSVGTANGTLFGDALATNGTLTLDGTNGTYVQLPAGILVGLPAVTVEAWASFGTEPVWTRLFDFGATDAGGNGQNYLGFSSHSGGGDLRVIASDADPGYNHEQIAARAGNLDNLGTVHIACVFDPANGREAVYTNGLLAAVNTAVTIPLTSISNALNYIGKSLYNGDPPLQAGIQEFRIYEQALTAQQIAASFQSGPKVPSVDPGTLLSIQSIITTNMTLNGVQNATVYASYSKATNVNITGTAGIAYGSSNTNIFTVSTAGRLKAVALGSATLSVSFNGMQSSNTVSVFLSNPVLKHRYSFNDSITSTQAVDSVGGTNFYGALTGGASYAGDGQLTLDGTTGYLTLPSGMISTMTNATFEAWVTVNALATWARIFDFGSNSAGLGNSGTGETYLFLAPRGGAGVVRFAATITSGGGETPVLDGPSALPVGQQSFVTVVYNVSGDTSKLYVNGVPVASGTATLPMSQILDQNNWLGRSQWNDPYFNGEMNEFRIYEGALSDQQIALDAAAGPDTLVTNVGTLQSLSINLSTNTLLVGGPLATASLFANFQVLSNVNVTAFTGATLTSSNTAVALVSTNGTVEAVGAGTATITGSYQGQSASVVVTVVAPVLPPPTLIHRYSFNDAPGSTTIADSVGPIDGSLIGNGTFTGTQLILPGTAGSYVSLPAPLISVLSNVTIEAWVTWQGNSAWQRIFDFGSSVGGPGAQGGGITYFYMTPLSGPGAYRFAATTNGGGAEFPVLNGPGPLGTNETHVAVTYNFAAGSARLFLNGQRVAIGPAVFPLSLLNEFNDYLGQSQYNDPALQGSYDEFRIYDGALTDSQIAAEFAAGPNTLPGHAINLTAALVGGQLVISWPANAPGTLQSSTNLGPAAVWSAVTPGPTVLNGQNQVTVNPSGKTQQFYQLRK